MIATRLKSLLNSPRLFSLADQGFQGLAGIIATALLGRVLSLTDFGAIGIMMGLYFLVHGFHRSAVVLPYITEHRPAADSPENRLHHGDWWWLSLGFSLMLAVLLILAAMVVRYGLPGWAKWMATPLLLSALITPPMLALEFTRRWFYKQERPFEAAIASAIFFCLLTGLTCFVALYHPDAASGAICWVAASTCGTIFALWRLCPTRPCLASSLDCLRRHRRFASWLMLTIIPYVIYSSSTVVVLIGIIIGPAAAAIFTACRTLTNPAISLVSAIDSLDKPKAARAYAEHGFSGLRRATHQTRRLITAATGSYLGLIAAFAGPLLALVFHDKYPGVETEIRLLTLAFFLTCLNQPSETMLIMLKASRTMFMTRMATAIVTLACLIIAIPHGIKGMAIAIMLSQLCNLALLLIVERRLVRRQTDRMPHAT